MVTAVSVGEAESPAILLNQIGFDEDQKKNTTKTKPDTRIGGGLTEKSMPTGLRLKVLQK